MSLTRARAVRVVCLMASFWRGRSGSLVIQQIIASMSWLGFGAFAGRAIMSPRETSTSSSRRTVTDMGGKASRELLVVQVDALRSSTSCRWAARRPRRPA